MATDRDPINQKRERYRAQAAQGQRLGYVLYAIATIFFFVGIATSFRSWLVTVIIGCLIVGSVILAVAIQVGYAIRGAERHEEDAKAQRRRR